MNNSVSSLANQININSHIFIRSASTIAKSKQRYKYKQESQYKQVSQSKSKSKSKSKPQSTLYEAPSLSDYVVDPSNNKNKQSGWNGIFAQCHTLLNYNPYGITSMMHSFNTSSTTLGCILFGAIYCCSYYSIYSFPQSWLFSWIVIRLFTDLFPILPKLYYYMIEQHAFAQFPVLKYLHFSRKLPNPDLQSFSSMVKDRMNENQKLKAKKRQLLKEEFQHMDVEDMYITDDMMAKQSVLASWKVRSRAHAKKYGLAWDLVENTSTLILMPFIMCLFQMVGIGDPLINALLQNDNIISAFLASNDWIIKVGTSYAVATCLTRVGAIPIFRYWCVPRSFYKFGPY